jgi:GntR family transcriptional regulator/MocR family aminotransferase
MPSDWSNRRISRRLETVSGREISSRGETVSGREISPRGETAGGGVSGRDLFVAVEDADGRGVGLEQALRDAIREGRLAAGTRLPSTRALAADLGWARGTVAGAYSQLVAEGWLAARTGAGTIVAAGRETATVEAREAPRERPPRYDLRTGSPDVASFPRRAWVAALRRVLREAGDEVLRLGDPRGRPELRAELAAYLGRARGVVATPERIVLCSGYVQALGLLATHLGRRVAMEDPCLALHREVVRAAGREVVPVTVDERGARIQDLAADAVVVTPAHQIGLGSTLAPERRAALAEWAHDHVVIEDDYDGEFRYDGRPVGALQALAPDHVVYAGTASKALSPALRIAWLVLPEHLVEPVVEAKRLADSASPALEQLALARLIATGELDRHLRRMRAHYRRRRDTLLNALPPAVRVLGIAAGLHVTLEVPGTEADVLAAAHERSLAITSLSAFWHEPAERPTLLQAGYATPPSHAFDGAVKALAEVMAAASPGS